MASNSRKSIALVVAWGSIASSLAFLQAILLGRTQPRNWDWVLGMLFSTLLGACAGMMQALVVHAVLSRVRAPTERLKSRYVRLAIFGTAASTGIVLPIATLLALVLFTRIWYELTGRTFVDFGGIALALLVFTFGYLAITSILGGIVAAILNLRERNPSVI